MSTSTREDVQSVTRAPTFGKQEGTTPVRTSIREEEFGLVWK